MSGSDIVSGTLELLVLKTLADGPLHGYAVGKAIKHASHEVLLIGENILYPALHRLEARGEVVGTWGKTPTGRDAKIYRLTAKGSERFAREASRWVQRSQAALEILGGGDA